MRTGSFVLFMSERDDLFMTEKDQGEMVLQRPRMGSSVVKYEAIIEGRYAEKRQSTHYKW